MQILTITISILALAVSIWTRIEAFYFGLHQRQGDIAKRVGEALVSAQNCKNKLSDLIQEAEKRLEISQEMNDTYAQAIRSQLLRSKADYEKVWELLQAFEAISLDIERGKRSRLKIAPIEAKIARFNQIKALCESDLSFLARGIDETLPPQIIR